MHTRSKPTLAALAATLLMSLAVSNATAARLSISNQNFRIVWNQLTFIGEGGIINPRIECPLTLEGSFHSRTIVKRQGALIGYITRAAFGPAEACTGVAATVLTDTLPWHVTYDSFTGTLPRITGIVLLLHTTAFLVELLGISCLYAEDGVRRARGTAIREAGGAIIGFSLDSTIRLPKVTGGGFCPPAFGFEGTGEVTLLGTTTRISVTLI